MDNSSIDILFPLDEWTLGPLCRGMDSNLTVRAIIDMWPSRAALAEDVGTPDDPVTLATVHKWAQRNSIPSQYHAPLLRAAGRREIALSANQLVAAHERPRRAA